MKYSHKTPEKSSISPSNHSGTSPRPGTALTAFLRRYLVELENWHLSHGDRHTEALIDCCAVLLNEAERGC